MPDYDRAVDMVDDLPTSTPTPENKAGEPVPANTPPETATAVAEAPDAPPPPIDTTDEAPEPEPEPEKKPEPPAAPSKKHWYVVKVQSGREESIKDAIERRVKIEGLEEFFGQIVVPVEKVTEMRNGKRVVKERKLYPGYLMCEVEYNDRILYLFRETSGVGDFVGGGLNHPPQPMKPKEVERMKGAIPTRPDEVHPKPR